MDKTGMVFMFGGSVKLAVDDKKAIRDTIANFNIIPGYLKDLLFFEDRGINEDGKKVYFIDFLDA